MAKKDEFDLDFDDFGGDMDFDLGDSKPLTRIEKVKRAAGGFKGGILDALKDPHVIASILNRSIPSEYGIDAKVAVTAAEDISLLMRKAHDEMSRVNNELKQSVSDSDEDLRQFLSPALYQKFKKYGDSRERRSSGPVVSAEDSLVAEHLGMFMEKQSAEEQGREQREVYRDIKKVKISTAQHGETIQAVGSMHRELMRQNSFNENVTAKYYRKQLEISVRHLSVAAQTLMIMRENAQVTQDNLLSLHKAIAKPEVIKLQEHELTRQKYGGGTGARSVFGGGSGVVERIRANAGRRATEMINSAGQMASMAIGFNPLASMGGMITPNMLYEEGGRMAGRTATRFVGGLAADRVRKMIGNSERGKRWGGNTRHFTQNFRRILEEQHIKGEQNEFAFDENGERVKNRMGPLVRLVRDLIGDDRGSRSIDIDNTGTLQEPHPFTKQSSRTLNEVIPGLLSGILSQVTELNTGKPAGRLTYDYAEGKFVQSKDQGKKVVHEFLRTGDGDLVKERTGKLIDSIDPEGKLDPVTRRKVAEQLLSDNYNNRLASTERLTSADTFKNLSPEQAAKVTGLFGKHFEGDANHERINEFSERFNDLLSGSNINRDQVQGLVNTGNREYLEAAGFIKDGVIDQHAIMRAMLSHDYGSVDSSLGRSLDRDRAEKQEAEDKAKAEATKWADRWKDLKGKVTGKVRDGLGAKDDQSTGSAFRAQAENLRDRAKEFYDEQDFAGRAQGFRDQAETLYRQSGLASRVSDLSDEAVKLLDEHGIDISKENLSQKAKEVLAKHGLLDKARELNGRTRKARIMARRKGRRARGKAAEGYASMASRAKDAYGQANEYARDFDPEREKARAKEMLKRAQQNWSENGIGGFVPASAEAIQARVTQALKDFDPKEVSAQLIERATELAVDAKGELKDFDTYKRDLIEAAQQQRARINDGVNARGGWRGIADNLKGRLKKLGLSAKDVGQEKLQEAGVQAEAVGEAVGERFSDVGQQIREAILEVKETLVNQHEEEKAEREGPRVGSYEDQLSKKKSGQGLKDLAKEKFQKGESGFGLLSMLMGGLGFVKKLMFGAGLGPLIAAAAKLGPLIRLMGEGAGLLFKGIRALGPLLSKIPGVGGALAAGGALLGKFGGSKLGQGLKTAGKIALVGPSAGQLWTATKFAGRAAWGTAELLGRGAVGAARLLPLLASPAGLAAAGAAAVVGGLGYGAYKAYKYFTRIEPTPLNNYRMVQYGFERDDGPKLRKIAEFESLMLAATVFKGETPQVRFDKVNWKKVFDIFGIDPQDKESRDTGHFEEWVVQRFNPVFSVWAGITKRITGGTDFEAAEKLKGQQLTDFVDGVKFTGFEYSTDLMNPLTKEPIIMGTADVRGMYEELKTWAEKKANEKSLLQKTGAGLAAAWTGIKAANKWVNDKLTGAAVSVLDKINPGGQIKNFLGKAADFLTKPLISGSILDSIKTGLGSIGDFFVRATGLDKVRRVTRLNGFGAIRMRMYGLIDLDYAKVRTLLHLEDFCQEDINYRKKEGVEYDGSVGDVAERFYGRFGITNKSGPEMTEWRVWFNTRFLPVFVNSCAVVHNITKEKDFAVGVEKLSKTDLLEAAKFILGTVTKDEDGNATTVWAVSARAWPREPINTNPDSVTANMRFLEQEAAAVKVAEDKAAEANAAQAGEPGTKPNPLDNGKSFDPNNVKTDYGGGAGKVASNTYGGVGSMSDGPGISVTQGAGGKASEITQPSGSGYEAMKGMIEQVANAVGIDPKLLAAVIAVESGFNPGVVNSETGAAGLGQMMPDTWPDLLKRYGARYGIPQNADPKNAVANALMTAEYIKQNLKGLSGSIKGRQPQPLDAYMAHFLGATGYKRFLDADPNALGKDISPAAAKSNPEIFYHDGRRKSQPRTVGEIMALMGSKLNNRAQEFGVIGKGDSLNLAMAGGSGQLPGGANVIGGKEATGDAVGSTAGQGPANQDPNAVRDRLLKMSETPGGRAVNTPMSIPAGSSSIPNADGVQSSSQSGPRVGSNGTPIVPELSKVKGMAGDAVLVREKSTESGTYGVLTLPDGTKINTLELPWKDNKPRESCIPPGTYECTIRQSPKFGTVYEVQGVQGRSAILFHAGNSAGDASRGMKADSQGCILLGLGRAMRGIQQIITQSSAAVKLFMERLGGKTFRLIVTGGGSATSYDQMAPQGAPITGPDGQVASPFTTTNPFDAANNTPVPTSSPSAQIPGMPGGEQTPTRDPYEPLNRPNAPKAPGDVLVRSLDVQTQTLGVLQAIKVLVERFAGGEAGTGRPMTPDERLRQEARERTAQADQSTRQRVNSPTNTPEPAVPYTRQI